MTYIEVVGSQCSSCRPAWCGRTGELVRPHHTGLQELHWLPIRRRSGGYHDGHPGLPVTVRHGFSLSSHQLPVGLWRRSSSAAFRHIMDVPCETNMQTACFAAAGPKLWNSLPAELRQADISFQRLKRLLKTFLLGCWDRGKLWLLKLHLIVVCYMCIFLACTISYLCVYFVVCVFWVFLCSFFLQYYDNVGWVFWPVKIVSHIIMAYTIVAKHSCGLPSSYTTPEIRIVIYWIFLLLIFNVSLHFVVVLVNKDNI